MLIQTLNSLKTAKNYRLSSQLLFIYIPLMKIRILNEIKAYLKKTRKILLKIRNLVYLLLFLIFKIYNNSDDFFMQHFHYKIYGKNIF